MAEYFNINYEFSPQKVWERIGRQIESGNPAYICGADGNILQMVHKDAEYRGVINGSMFSICDSSWVPVYLKKLYGMDVQQYCGSQIFEDALKQKKYRMFFMGTSDAILQPLKQNLTEKYDARIDEMTFYELPFCNADDFDYNAIAEVVNRDSPDIIWVALGAPKQEIFISRLKPYLKSGVMIAVGAVFKFYSGVGEKRAPAWMVRNHIEFVYRIFSEPRKQLQRCWAIATTLPSILAEERRKIEQSKI